jgi:putative FmdB family regulatory protein
MPIYEFVCKKCQKFFEKFVFSSSDTNQVDCPHCGDNNVEKQISRFSSQCNCGDSAKNSTPSGNNCVTRRFG